MNPPEQVVHTRCPLQFWRVWSTASTLDPPDQFLPVNRCMRAALHRRPWPAGVVWVVDRDLTGSKIRLQNSFLLRGNALHLHTVSPYFGIVRILLIGRATIDCHDRDVKLGQLYVDVELSLVPPDGNRFSQQALVVAREHWPVTLVRCVQVASIVRTGCRVVRRRRRDASKEAGTRFRSQVSEVESESGSEQRTVPLVRFQTYVVTMLRACDVLCRKWKLAYSEKAPSSA